MSLFGQEEVVKEKEVKVKIQCWDFPGGLVVEILFASAGDRGSILVQKDPTCYKATKPVHRNY